MYVIQSEIEAAIPAPLLVEALDDNRDGTADDGVMSSVITQACQAVDAYLAGLFAVPFVTEPDKPLPSVVKQAAFVFACELIYQRRAVAEGENPFAKQADAWRTRLEKIGRGELPLDATQVKSFTPGSAITAPVAVNAQST